jgi:signal transduction histidine kinase
METDLRILLLEDVMEEAKLIERTIKKEKFRFESLRVDAREQFIEAMNNFRPHVVLSDHALPQFNSIEALKLAKSIDPSVAFILVTGAVSEEFAVACLKQGANDYVLKSNLSRLPSALKQALAQKETEQKKKEAEETLQEQNQRLKHSNEELLKTNQELDSFVYSVSHNLRGPLSSILGLVNISRCGDINPAELFNKIEHSVKKLDETLKEILDYSRNTRTDVKEEHVPIEQLFRENCEKLAYLPHAEYHQFQFSSNGPAEIFTDRYRFNLIVNNLLSNSIKYCDEEKEIKYVKLTVTPNNDDVSLEFEDNGIGISDEAMPKIFNMFYRGTIKSSGAGLGLYIVKEAVEKLRGSIQVESAEKVGTKVKINLPKYALQ